MLGVQYTRVILRVFFLRVCVCPDIYCMCSPKIVTVSLWFLSTSLTSEIPSLTPLTSHYISILLLQILETETTAVALRTLTHPSHLRLQLCFRDLYG